MKTIRNLGCLTALVTMLWSGGWAQTAAERHLVKAPSPAPSETTKGTSVGSTKIRFEDQPAEKQAYMRMHPDQYPVGSDGMVEVKGTDLNKVTAPGPKAVPVEVTESPEEAPAVAPEPVEKGAPASAGEVPSFIPNDGPQVRAGDKKESVYTPTTHPVNGASAPPPSLRAAGAPAHQPDNGSVTGKKMDYTKSTTPHGTTR